MNLIAHQKYIIDRLLATEDPVSNLSIFLQNAHLEKKSFEYLKEKISSLGYRLKYPNQYQNSMIVKGSRSRSPLTSDPCKPTTGEGCYFIPIINGKTHQYEDYSR